MALALLSCGPCCFSEGHYGLSAAEMSVQEKDASGTAASASDEKTEKLSPEDFQKRLAAIRELRRNGSMDAYVRAALELAANPDLDNTQQISILNETLNGAVEKKNTAALNQIGDAVLNLSAENRAFLGGEFIQKASEYALEQ